MTGRNRYCLALAVVDSEGCSRYFTSVENYQQYVGYVPIVGCVKNVLRQSIKKYSVLPSSGNFAIWNSSKLFNLVDKSTFADDCLSGGRLCPCGK